MIPKDASASKKKICNKMSWSARGILGPQPPPTQNISFIAQLWQNFCHQDQDGGDDDDYIV